MFTSLSAVFQAGRKERSDALNSAIDKMTKKTRDLRRQVMDVAEVVLAETNECLAACLPSGECWLGICFCWAVGLLACLQ